jgi:hypothetical protein
VIKVDDTLILQGGTCRSRAARGPREAEARP